MGPLFFILYLHYCPKIGNAFLSTFVRLNKKKWGRGIKNLKKKMLIGASTEAKAESMAEPRVMKRQIATANAKVPLHIRRHLQPDADQK